jgi:hypothetical protein
MDDGLTKYETGEALPVVYKKPRKPRVKKVKEADVQQAIPIVSPGEAIAIHPVEAQAKAVAEREGIRKDHRRSEERL